jgi:hypothetical protein
MAAGRVPFAIDAMLDLAYPQQAFSTSTNSP